MRTRKWLHSHLHASPITGNLEVSIIYDVPVGILAFDSLLALYKFRII